MSGCRNTAPTCRHAALPHMHLKIFLAPPTLLFAACRVWNQSGQRVKDFCLLQNSTQQVGTFSAAAAGTIFSSIVCNVLLAVAPERAGAALRAVHSLPVV